MASRSSVVHTDVDATAPVQPPGATTSPVVSDLPPGGEDSVQEPHRLPDICNLEWQKEGMPDTDFNRKYPPDAWGEETAPNARVWKVYRDHQTVADRGMLNSWNKTLDVLLIFAGLFSAVSTAFLIESYKTLQPDYTQYMAAFLYAAAVSNNGTGGVFPPLDEIVAPDRFIQTSAVQRWTNGLWFSSLVISLAVALLCILVKQWLDEYESHVSSATPSPIYWARRHSLYSRGLETWGVPGIISFLPLLLHVSLFLFYGGLVLFLLPLDAPIAYSLLVMVVCILTFYGLSLILPAWRVECPYYTPLLSQALRTVSHGISCIRYLRTLPKQLCRLVSRPRFNDRRAHPSPDEPSDMVGGLAVWPRESITASSRQRLEREKQVVSKFDLELDGYVLSALINLPSDPNWGIVDTACAAIGAVTSVRTIKIICRQVSHFPSKFFASGRKIGSQPTGFTITAHAQLQRAHRVIELRTLMMMADTEHLAYGPGLVSSLGIDGLLIQAMRVRNADERSHYVALLFRSLRSLLVDVDRPHASPLPSICLMFLEHHVRHPVGDNLFFSSFLLVFCAGRFTSDEFEYSPGYYRVLHSVETMLRMQCTISPQRDNNGERYPVAQGLWTILLDPERYHIDTVTARLVAGQACLFCWKSYPFSGPAEWAHLSSLSAFVRSPSFGQCVATSDSLDLYLRLFCRLHLDDRAEAQLLDYWECFAILLKMSSHHAPRPDVGIWFDRQFPVSGVDWINMSLRRQSRLTVGKDDWYEPALSAFLVGANSFATWTDAPSMYVLGLADLADRISIALCRRQRLGRSNNDYIRSFVSGSFLLARFRDLISREHIPGKKWDDTVQRILTELAKHCMRLSPAAYLDICMQLEEIGDPGSDLRARAVAFAQRIRDGSTTGGELAGECSPDCPCMIDGAGTVSGRRIRWESLVARFRPGRSASVTSRNV